jgi:hypothetical protein
MTQFARTAWSIVMIAVLIWFGLARSQERPLEHSDPRLLREAPAEFQFVRLAYSSNNFGRGWGRRQMWQTDWPDAESHFVKGIDRLTRVSTAEKPRILTPLDEEIYDYPWIYAVEVGNWYLNDQEAARIRDYLLRGGFLMVDDFHGSYEWAAFMESMEKVFPDRPVVEISESDEAFHVIYDLDKRVQIPSRMFIYSGVTWEKGGITPHWRGIYDDDGRLMVAINFNMDIGDAWEHADWPDYPENMTALAYRFGINYLVYAMTH